MSKYKIDAPKFDKDSRELQNNIEKLDLELKNILLAPNEFTAIKSNKVEFLKKDCETKIIMMKTDLNMIPDSAKKKDEVLISLCQLNKLITKFDTCKQNYIKVLNFDKKVKKSIKQQDEKTQFVGVAKSIKNGTNMIKEATKTMLSVEEDEKEVMTELIKHRNIIEESSKKLDQTEGYLNQSQRVLRSLYKKVITNKLILIGLIIVLGLLNMLILYMKLKSKLGYS